MVSQAQVVCRNLDERTGRMENPLWRTLKEEEERLLNPPSDDENNFLRQLGRYAAAPPRRPDAEVAREAEGWVGPTVFFIIRWKNVVYVQSIYIF